MLLVDAYNVVRAQWVLPASRRGLDVRGLIGLIGRSRFAGRRLRVVVDGRPSPDWLRHGVYDTLAGHAWSRLGRAEIVFSGRDAEADDVIEEILDRTRGVAITVVSSDRRLVRAAGRAGADQIGNGSFLRLLNEDLDRADAERLPAFAAEVPLDPESVAHWMREFGFEPPPPQRPAPAGPPPSRSPKPKVGPASSRPPKSVVGPASSRPLPPTPNKRPAESPPHHATGNPPDLPDHGPTLDPLLHDAFEEWYGALHSGDLDMRKWVDGVEPF